jgi:hypothetical protein
VENETQSKVNFIKNIFKNKPRRDLLEEINKLWKINSESLGKVNEIMEQNQGQVIQIEDLLNKQDNLKKQLESNVNLNLKRCEEKYLLDFEEILKKLKFTEIDFGKKENQIEFTILNDDLSNMEEFQNQQIKRKELQMIDYINLVILINQNKFKEATKLYLTFGESSYNSVQKTIKSAKNIYLWYKLKKIFGSGNSLIQSIPSDNITFFQTLPFPNIDSINALLKTKFPDEKERNKFLEKEFSFLNKRNNNVKQLYENVTKMLNLQIDENNLTMKNLEIKSKKKKREPEEEEEEDMKKKKKK